MDRTRGSGLNRERWYSICSRHCDYETYCGTCNVGQWVNCFAASLERITFQVSPWLWRKWANRTSSPSKKLHSPARVRLSKRTQSDGSPDSGEANKK